MSFKRYLTASEWYLAITELIETMIIVLTELLDINSKFLTLSTIDRYLAEEVKQLRLENDENRNRIAIVENVIHRNNLMVTQLPIEPPWPVHRHRVIERVTNLPVIAELETEYTGDSFEATIPSEKDEQLNDAGKLMKWSDDGQKGMANFLFC